MPRPTSPLPESIQPPFLRRLCRAFVADPAPALSLLPRRVPFAMVKARSRWNEGDEDTQRTAVGAAVRLCVPQEACRLKSLRKSNDNEIDR